jgi:hypothetical protein
MIGASLYIIGCSARNRAARRLRRLREPRYLIGALAGVVYLTFTLIIRQRAYRDDRPSRARPLGAGAATLFGVPGPVVGGVLLACASLASWMLPFNSGLLEFSRAETALLFPAPLTRRQLVAHRLLRSQAAVLTGALIIALAYPTGSAAARLRGLISMWLLLMTSHVFFTGITLARAGLRRGIRAVPFVWPAAALSLGAVGGVAGALLGASRRGVPLDSPGEVLDLVSAAAMHGPTRWFLAPFAALVHPLFASTTGEFLQALAGGLAVYALCVVWLFWADAKSSEAAADAMERQIARPARRGPTYVARPVGWRLSPTGRVETTFVWKAILQMLRTVDRRVFVRSSTILAWMIVVSLLMTRARGLTTIIGVFALWGALFSVFMGPQIIRMDLRDELAHLEWIKTWPVRGAAVIRGEIVWPTVVITLATWAFVLTALVMGAPFSRRVPELYRAAVWLSAIVLVPGVVLAQYTMHNAVALLFPGWVPIGSSRARGVDAVGQRLIVLLGNWLGLIIALAPGILVTIVLSWWLRSVAGPFVLPIGALVTTLTVVAETWVVSRWLEPVFDRLDITSVERGD